MIRLYKFATSHLDVIDLQEKQLFHKELIQKQEFRELLEINKENAYTLIDMDKLEVIGIAGAIHLGLDRYEGWALLSRDAKKYMTRITKAVKMFLNKANYNRFEIYVDSQFKEAYRWAKMLGFEEEGLMKNFIGKNNYYLFARYK